MKHPELPADEQQRLEELWRYSLRDASQDNRLDATTKLVAQYFDSPIVLVSFVDQQCQWFKSHHGIDTAQTPRHSSFCAHAIQSDQPIFEVKDAHQDPRFCHNPLVTGPPYIRYYAGAPLITAAGFKLGTLCIIDSQPRNIHPEKLNQLSEFAHHVMEHLELQRLHRLLDIVDESDIGLWELDAASGAIWWNNTQSRLLLADNHQPLTNGSYEAESQRRFEHAIAQAIATGNTFSTDLKLQRPAHAPPAWVHVTGSALKANGDITQLAGTVQNITQLKEKEAGLARHARIEQLINELQAAFIGNRQTNDTFRKALEKLLLATESEAGFIGEVKYREDGTTPYLKMHALTDISWDKEEFDRFSASAPAGMEFTRLKSLFGHVILHKEIVISNAPASDHRSGGVPQGHPRLESFLGLPAVDDHGNIIAVIGLANRAQGYDEAFSQELEPLQQRLGQLITTFNLRKEQQRSQKRLEMAAKVFDSSHNAIVITDDQFLILDVNPAFEAETGYLREEVVGSSTGFLAAKGAQLSIEQALRHAKNSARQSGAHQSGANQNKASQNKASQNKASQSSDCWEGEVLNVRKDGEPLPESVSISVVRDTAGDVTNYVLALTDLRHIKQHNKALDRANHFDTLTGLPNRTYLVQLMRKTMQSDGDASGLAIVVIDLDRFNSVNQLLDTAQGDKLLIDISEKLARHLKAGEILARINGDEFGLVLTRDASLLDRLDTMLYDIVQTHPLPSGETLTTTGSMGVTFYPDDNTDPDTLLRHAFQAMFRAKEESGHRYVIFNTQHEQEFKFIQQLRKDVAHGLKNNEFVLELQPQVDAQSLRLMGVEALIRWNHPLGRRMPDAFLPYIIDSTLEHDIDEWVVHQAFMLLDKWQHDAPDLCISINITPQTFANQSLIGMLDSARQRYPAVNLKRLHIEVLESAAIEELQVATDVMKACQTRGVHVALDDFGTGYSSLTYLKSLPADIVKIDRSFVIDMLDNQDDLAIVESVIYLAKRFGKTVVAEGVETEAHIEALRRIGCNVLQGYGIAKPMALERFTEWQCQAEAL
ncbi:MAG: diguanylate cyclase/phosphodiesterase [Halomonas sp. 54_146]|nr:MULTISPECIES: EAL domain-containing protein [unclassified Halomonas]KUJ86637.1 MAG: diguanylate cyclase/phosphodiesterase [Halomonas sp. 54_146]HAA43996.1 diguanylate cyclase [Halomonas sp.]